MDVVLFMSAVTSDDSILVSFPVQISTDHKYTVCESHNSKDFMPTCEDFSGRNCLNDKQPFHSVRESSIEMF
jgi:hypothetical protein